MIAAVERLLFVLVVALFGLVLQPWHLENWLVDLALGVILYAIFCNRHASSLPLAFLGVALAVALYLAGVLIASYYGIPLEKFANSFLSQDRFGMFPMPQ